MAVTPTVTNMVGGNWQMNSSDAAAAKLPAFSGSITNGGTTITAVMHTQGADACLAPGTAFHLSGSANAKDVVTLSGPLAGGTMTVEGTLAADGRSLTNASYAVVGGTCDLPAQVKAVAEQFQPITGSYVGNLADTSGQVAQVSANFSQSTTPDQNGDFTLAGSATIVADPCFPSNVTVSNTAVTGGNFTYTITANGSTVTANGTFSSDASTLTVTSWTLSGTCGSDTGVQSTLTKQ